MKKKRTSVARSKPRRQKSASPSETAAIVKVATPPERPWELTSEQVVLLKNYLKIADASEVELKGCLEVARRYRMDPFKQGQIWFIKRWDKNAVTVTGAKGGCIYTPQVGIYGMLHIAARDHTDFGSVSEAEYGPMFFHEVEGHKFKAPEWCRVKAFQEGITEPTVATIYFEEFCPAAWDNARLFWARMPRAQIEKCAKARAIRTAYPDLGGLYIPEECEKFNEDFPPSGRQIVRPRQDASGSHEAAQKVLQDKLAANMALNPAIDVPGQSESQQPTSAERQHPAQGGRRDASTGPASPSSRRDDVPAVASDRSRGESPRKVPKGKIPESEYRKDNIPPAKQAEPWKYNGSIELDYSDDHTMPYVRGDIAELAGHFPKDLTLRRRNDFWCCFAEDVPRIKLVANAQNFRVNEVLPSPPAKSKEAKTKPTSAKSGQESAGPRLAKGIIERVISGMTGNNNPLRNVTMLLPDKRRPSFSCFDKALFEWLDKGNGKPAELYVQTRGKYTNIVGLKLCAGKEFDSDGKTPVIQRKDQQPGKTLFG